MKAIVMNRPGGTEVLEMVDLPEPVAAPGQVLVEVAAAGVNFMDIGVRRGMTGRDIEYPQILGVEGAGRVMGSARVSKISRSANVSTGRARR